MNEELTHYANVAADMTVHLPAWATAAQMLEFADTAMKFAANNAGFIEPDVPEEEVCKVVPHLESPRPYIWIKFAGADASDMIGFLTEFERFRVFFWDAREPVDMRAGRYAREIRERRDFEAKADAAFGENADELDVFGYGARPATGDHGPIPPGAPRHRNRSRPGRPLGKPGGKNEASKQSHGDC